MVSQKSPKRYFKSALKEPNMFAWIMHRITGVAIILFFAWHVLDLITLAFKSSISIATLQPYFGNFTSADGITTVILNIIFVAVVVFHGLNGLRIILHDMFPSLNKYYNQIFWVFMIVAILAMIGSGYFVVLFTKVIVHS